MISFLLIYLRPAFLKIFPATQNLLVHLPVGLAHCILEVNDVVVDVDDVLLAILSHRLTTLTCVLLQSSPGFTDALHDISPSLLQSLLQPKNILVNSIHLGHCLKPVLLNI